MAVYVPGRGLFLAQARGASSSIERALLVAFKEEQAVGLRPKHGSVEEVRRAVRRPANPPIPRRPEKVVSNVRNPFETIATWFALYARGGETVADFCHRYRSTNFVRPERKFSLMYHLNETTEAPIRFESIAEDLRRVFGRAVHLPHLNRTEQKSDRWRMYYRGRDVDYVRDRFWAEFEAFPYYTFD